MSDVGTKRNSGCIYAYQPALAVNIFWERQYTSMNHSENIAQFIACVDAVWICQIQWNGRIVTFKTICNKPSNFLKCVWYFCHPTNVLIEHLSIGRSSSIRKLLNLSLKKSKCSHTHTHIPLNHKPMVIEIWGLLCLPVGSAFTKDSAYSYLSWSSMSTVAYFSLQKSWK